MRRSCLANQYQTVGTVDGVFVSQQRGQIRSHWNRFLRYVPSKSDPKKGWRYLVTARHIVDPVWAKQCIRDESGKSRPLTNPARLYARMNLKQYDPASPRPGFEFI